MLRTGAKFGLVELTFTIETPELEEQLADMDLSVRALQLP